MGHSYDEAESRTNITCPTLGIIVPCYNEQDVVMFCFEQLDALLSGLIAAQKISASSFILFVDDGSSDNTWKRIVSLRNNNRVCGIKLSKNVGQQNALVAGLDFCRERVDIAISTDVDLQDDILAINKMIAHYQKGADIVLGVHSNRSSDSRWKRMSAAVFYRVMKCLGAQGISQHADFRLLSKKAIDALAEFSERNLYLRGVSASLGFKMSTVEVTRSARTFGYSKYSFYKMLNLALSGITSTTILPLRLIFVMGLGAFIMSLVAIFWAVYICYFTALPAPVWVTVALPLYFIGSIQLLSLGVVGEYLAQAHLETKRRPRYLIDLQFS